MQPRQTTLVALAQALRFDGLRGHKFAYLGCVYGPDWWKRYPPPAVAAIIFALVGRNRRGTVANMERILGLNGAPAGAAALRMLAEVAHCVTETMEYYGRVPSPSV